jgi:hypothetical protein
VIGRLAGGTLAAVIAIAPLQCSHTPDPADRLEDTAGDALWGLAERFRAQHEEQARNETLKYLVTRYPSNRHAPEARAELAAAGVSAGESSGGAPRASESVSLAPDGG